MKTFIATVLFLLASVSFAQSPSFEYKIYPVDTLVQGTEDTIRYELGAKYNKLYMTAFDSGSTYIDTVICEVYSPGRATWIRVGVTSMFANTTSAFIIPGANYYQTFRILHEGANRIRFRYLSPGYLATVGRRTFLQLEATRNY